MNTDIFDRPISVIVPVYNSETTICKCVKSLICQTVNIEIILVDDGSEDLSGEICEKFSAQIPYISVVHKKNGGVSSARNEGLTLANGKYIMFCDSDDYVEPAWCSRLLAVIEQNPDSFVVCDIIREKTDNEVVLSSNHEGSIEEISYFDLYKKGLSAYTWNKIYDREKIEKNKLKFDEDCSFAEDVAFNVAYCSLCNGCIFIQRQLYHYVQQAGSLMHKYYPNYFEMHLQIFICRLPLIQEQDVSEYCDIWLYQFLQMLENIFKSEKITFLSKLKYNQKMIKTNEFQLCLELATGKKENPIVIKILKMKNYYILWTLQEITKLKQRMLGGKRI